jgi:hypothetical protein
MPPFSLTNMAVFLMMRTRTTKMTWVTQEAVEIENPVLSADENDISELCGARESEAQENLRRSTSEVNSPWQREVGERNMKPQTRGSGPRSRSSKALEGVGTVVLMSRKPGLLPYTASCNQRQRIHRSNQPSHYPWRYLTALDRLPAKTTWRDTQQCETLKGHATACQPHTSQAYTSTEAAGRDFLLPQRSVSVRCGAVDITCVHA